jgi:hypothetical protein
MRHFVAYYLLQTIVNLRKEDKVQTGRIDRAVDRLRKLRNCPSTCLAVLFEYGVLQHSSFLLRLGFAGKYYANPVSRIQFS